MFGGIYQVAALRVKLLSMNAGLFFVVDSNSDDDDAVRLVLPYQCYTVTSRWSCCWQLVCYQD